MRAVGFALLAAATVFVGIAGASSCSVFLNPQIPNPEASVSDVVVNDDWGVNAAVAERCCGRDSQTCVSIGDGAAYPTSCKQNSDCVIAYGGQFCSSPGCSCALEPFPTNTAGFEMYDAALSSLSECANVLQKLREFAEDPTFQASSVGIACQGLLEVCACPEITSCYAYCNDGGCEITSDASVEGLEGSVGYGYCY
jgi:hypothetical protein